MVFILSWQRCFAENVKNPASEKGSNFGMWNATVPAALWNQHRHVRIFSPIYSISKDVYARNSSPFWRNQLVKQGTRYTRGQYKTESSNQLISPVKDLDIYVSGPV